MGGFVIQAKDLGPSYGTGVFVLSEQGIEFLAETEPESIPNIPESEILDKSKASTLTKIIVCLQALWFCIQCIARLSQGASISFLELNVLGHCLCAFATYAIWWKKPTDVSQPTSLSVSDGLREYVDVVYPFSGRPGALPTFPTVPGMRSSVRALRFEDYTNIDPDPQCFEFITNKFLFGDLLLSRMSVHVHRGKPRLCSCRSIRTNICCSVKEHKGRRRYVLNLQFHSSFWIEYTLSSHDKKRQITLENPDVPQIIFDLETTMAERLERTSKSRYQIGSYKTSIHRMRNWSLSEVSIDNAVAFKEPLSSITLVIVALVYGGLHLLAWNAPFHTRVEETLWKISGISVASIGPMSIAYAGLLSITHKFFSHIHRRWRHNRWDPSKTRYQSKTIQFLLVSEKIVGKITQFLGVSYLLFYSFTRVYLVVECFIEVAYLPDSAFTTPVFTRYIPHLG